MTTARIMLPPDLEEKERAAYEHLRSVKMLTREEAVREIKLRRARKVVNLISQIASKDLKR